MSRAADPSASADDAPLVEAMARGDRDALGELYDRHAPTLLGIARRLMSREAEAHDLLHDVFLEAWERAATFDPRRGSVRTWLAVRLRSRALDRLGSAHARHTVLLSTPSREHGSTARDDERLGVRQAVRQLPDVSRSLLELLYFEGMTAEEAATRLEVPLGTIKSRKARALALLAATLTDGATDDER